MATCRWCGVELTGRATMYCSRQHGDSYRSRPRAQRQKQARQAKNAQPRECPWCHELVVMTPTQRYCCSEHQAMASLARKAGEPAAPPKQLGLTAEKIAEVKRQYPSCARDWDIDMVDVAWDRLMHLLPRRMERLAEPSALTRKIQERIDREEAALRSDPSVG